MFPRKILPEESKIGTQRYPEVSKIFNASSNVLVSVTVVDLFSYIQVFLIASLYLQLSHFSLISN